MGVAKKEKNKRESSSPAIHTHYSARDSRQCEVELSKLFETQFSKVCAWHPGLLHKAKKILTPQLFQLVKSDLLERTFCVTTDGCTSSIKAIEAGVPQGSMLGPTLYSIFSADMPTRTAVTELDRKDVLIARYADTQRY